MEKDSKPVDRHCRRIRAYELRHNPRTSPAAYPTIPSGATSHSLLRRLQRSATRGRPFSFRGPPPPTGKAMGNEPIEGDEWGAYVTLDTFNTDGTRDGLTGASPKVTESL